MDIKANKVTAAAEALKGLNSVEMLQVLRESGIMDVLRNGQASEREKFEAKEAELAAYAEIVGRGAQARTQEIADQMFDGPRRFAVAIHDGAQPKLVIAAEDEDQATYRYNKVCGIRALTDGKSHKIAEVTGDEIPDLDDEADDDETPRKRKGKKKKASSRELDPELVGGPVE
jgi:hypothetical protein